MRDVEYKLSDLKVKKAAPAEKAYKLIDGGGLFLHVLPTGRKVWRYQYSFNGKRRDVTIGTYPAVPLEKAHRMHSEYRALRERGIDPADQKQEEKRKKQESARQKRISTFKALSLLWLKERMASRATSYVNQQQGWLERFVWPDIGEVPVSEIRPADVLRIIEPLRKTPVTADGVRVLIQSVLDHGIRKLLIDTNAARPLRGVIEVPAPTHHRHLSERELGAFWRSLNEGHAHYQTVVAAKLLMLTMCRKSEITKARWAEVDLDSAQWTIPAERMKAKRPHRVYLSRQAVDLLRQLHNFSGDGEYLFPNVYHPKRPLGDATLNSYFKRLDFGVEGFSPHGTRGTAATLLREHGFDRAVVELLLAHTERDKTAASYHHHELPDERRRALQFLADRIDALAADNVVPMRRAS